VSGDTDTTSECIEFLAALRAATKLATLWGESQGTPVWNERTVFFLSDAAMAVKDGEWFVGNPLEQIAERSCDAAMWALARTVVGSDVWARVVEAVGLCPRAAELFLVDAGGTPLREDQQSSWLESILFGRVLELYLREIESPTVAWREDLWQRVESTMVEFMDRKVERVLLSVPLENFHMVQDRLDVRKDLWIDKISVEEKRMHFATPDRSELVPSRWMAIARWTHAIRSVIDAPKLSYGGGGLSPGAISLLSALRLLQHGRVDYTTTWTSEIGPTLLVARTRSDGGTTSCQMPDYELQLEDSTQPILSELVDRLETLREGTAPALALRRFMSLYGRASLEDRALDAWIGLEAIFARADETTEINYRLRQRIARLLGKTSDERKSLFTQVGKLYRTRSKIAHGAVETDAGILADVEATEDLLRLALRKNLTGPGWSIESIIDDLFR